MLFILKRHIQRKIAGLLHVLRDSDHLDDENVRTYDDGEDALRVSCPRRTVSPVSPGAVSLSPRLPVSRSPLLLDGVKHARQNDVEVIVRWQA